MHVLITGNMGYVGPVLVNRLRHSRPGATLSGFDGGWFAHCLSEPGPLPERLLDRQHFGDVRDLPGDLLEGVDAVVHLAAVSNDPMGDAFEEVTLEINHRASVDLAARAREAGVTSFVFASSCSIYGTADDGARDEDSPLQPLTAYARSKVQTERDLLPLAGDEFRVSCLRFATACGMSPRLRLDLVLNDFVATALATGRIQVLSDGTPWRPLIHVDDMARAIDWALDRGDGDPFLTLNTGSDDWNYQIRDLATAVAEVLPGVDVEINHDAPPDKRSYRVSFERFRELAPESQPRVGLADAVRGLADGLRALGFRDAGFRDSEWMRLGVLTRFREQGLLDGSLRWTAG